MEIIFATNNLHKLRELQQLVPLNIQLKKLSDIGCTEDIPEEEPTIEANAEFKARYVYEKYGHNCFADDTGLEVEALDGRPGVHSARYAHPQINDSEKNIQKLLEQLQGQTNRKARFKTVIALIIDGKTHLFEGIVNGTITTAKQGTDGFGYDPVFVPDGYQKSFAQISAVEKNNISHRGIAVRKLINYLNFIK